jgi:hypothetical protein
MASTRLVVLLAFTILSGLMYLQQPAMTFVPERELGRFLSIAVP